MANIKISELEQISTVENDDILPIVDSSATETKKILLSQLREVTAYDTLPVGTEVDYDGQTVPDGWTEVSEYETGNGSFDTSSQFEGNYQYVKYGKIVQLYAWIVFKQTITTQWTTLTLVTLPDKIKPKLVKNAHVMRDNDNRVYLVSANTDGTLRIADRGRGNITASPEGIPVTLTYIAAN